MGLPKKKLSTILIIDQQSGKTRSLQVRTSLVGKIRQYAVYLFLFLAGMVGFVLFLSYRDTVREQQMASLLKEVTELRKGPTVVEDTTKVIKYIQGIEGKLKKINQYLNKRGVSGFSYTYGAGGGDKDKTADLPVNEAYTYFTDYLDKVFYGISRTPMGYPGHSLITSVYGYRNNPFSSSEGEFHPGLDFKANKGDAVKSTAGGTVVFAGWSNGYGKCIRIRHGNRYETLYGHLSAIVVHEGQTIAANQLIGKVGSTGRSTGYHLHYEVRKENRPLNPKNFLRLN